MPLTISRRRLLITAPLAIILPAGLITYLGLKGVATLEQTVEPCLNADIDSHRQTLDDYFNLDLIRRESEFGAALRLWLADEDERGDARRIEELGERFVLAHPLPFVRFIFSRSGDGEIIFYARDPGVEGGVKIGAAQPPLQSVWIRFAHPPEEMVQDLNTELDKNEKEDIQVVRADSAQALTRFDRGPCLDGSGCHTQSVFTSFQLPDYPERLFFFGFVYDLACLRDILQSVVINLFERGLGIAEYQLEVTDERNEIIATSTPERSGIFDPEPGDRLLTFRYWGVRYSEDSGIRRVLNMAEYRAFHIPLIITAAVIMILAVFQSIRNLARELNLAKMRSDFVARVSHELRTPLGLIRLFAETLEMGRIEDKEKSREYLHTITRESERLSKLIDNVLDFSKIEAGQKQYQLGLGSIADIVESVTESMRFHMSRNNLDLQVNMEPNLPMVHMDREAMAQALWNLLSNAVKYSGDGRVVEVEARRADGEVRVSVCDHGIGIAPHEMKRICQQFYRVDDPRVQERGGSGLGLSVVKHIMEGHNGRLVIDSTFGQGSTFSLCLPIPDRSSTPADVKRKGTKT
ncbi:MAG: ATP-binding protein [bacterium]